MAEKPAFVVGFLKDFNGNLLLVRKERPSWQQGRLNGIGGKIEVGELPIDAMRREWNEETGFTYDAWHYFARLRGDDYDVYFYRGLVVELPVVPPKNDRGEQLLVVNIAALHQRTDLISNLRWLVPLAFEDNRAPFADVLNANPGLEGRAVMQAAEARVLAMRGGYDVPGFEESVKAEFEEMHRISQAVAA